MADVLPDLSGGIASLFTLPDEVWEALEADLARAGWSVEQIPGELSWRAVLSLIRHRTSTDAVHLALSEAGAVEQDRRMSDEIKDSIAAAKAAGLA